MRSMEEGASRSEGREAPGRGSKGAEEGAKSNRAERSKTERSDRAGKEEGARR